MKSYDVVITGGGLAGLTCALYLRRQLPAISIAVIEPSRRPLPEACFKVGESSVEIGAGWFENDKWCGLRKYLDEHQLRKNGLRYFTGDTQGPLAARREIGPSEQPVVPAFQLDRGKLENDLRAMVEEARVDLYEGWSTYAIELATGDARHVVKIATEGKKEELDCRWVLDASGRRRLIQKKLGLTRDSDHTHSSSWFRIARRFDVSTLVPASETAWHARDVDKNRWLSTVHLMGKGYWVWLIPLSSGLHSVGIVAGGEHHPLETFARPETAMAWIAKHEPVLYEKLKDETIEDFKFLRYFAYTSAQVFSADRWACVGEAGVFVDPLYSPGSDLIALACVLAVELVKADLDAKASRPMLEARAKESNEFFLGFTEVTTTTFRRHSHINGAPVALAAKLYWDNFHYWSFVCQYFFQRLYRLPPAGHARFRELHKKFAALNVKAQKVLKAWASIAPQDEPGRVWGDFVPLPQFPSLLADLHLDLQNERDADATYDVMAKNLAGAEEVVAELVLRALKAVGPTNVSRFAEDSGFASWGLVFDPVRLAYDESPDRSALRKQLPRIARDMERCLGRSENDGVAPTMRELVKLAMGTGGRDSKATVSLRAVTEE